MKYEDTYKRCKRLAVKYGRQVQDSEDSSYKVYMDDLGCDFRIYYDMVAGTMDVFLGGKEVYAFHDRSSGGEYMDGGRWEKLVRKLYEYELNRSKNTEAHKIGGFLLRRCQKDAAKNRKVMNKYCGLCAKLAENGRVKMSSRDSHCSWFEDTVDGHKVEAISNEMVRKGDCRSTIKLSFDGKLVFTFQYVLSDKDGSLDEKGKYIPGEWEYIVETVAGKMADDK